MLLIPDFHPERLYSNGYHRWLDILQHSGYFFAFTLAVLWVFPSFRRFHPYYWLLVALATALETMQLWIPRRSFSPMDMCSNLIGISMAYFCWWAAGAIRKRRSR